MRGTILLALLLAALALPAWSEGRLATLEEVAVTPQEGTASELAYAPAADRIAYRLDWASKGVGLWVCDGNGKNHVWVAPDTDPERLHVLGLSPDGQCVVYERSTQESPPNLLGVGIVNVEHGRKIELEGTSAVWSRKGDRLAVADPTAGEITVVDLNTLGKRVVAKMPGSGDPYEQPSMTWSPDDTTIAYTTREADNSVTSLWVAGVGDARKVAEEEGCDAVQPFWSPDGRLAWRVTRTGDAAGSRHFVEEGEGKAKELPCGERLDLLGGTVWSADGKSLVFARAREAADGKGLATSDLWAMDAATGGLRRLTESGDVRGELLWSADGRTIYVLEPGRLRRARIGG